MSAAPAPVGLVLREVAVADRAALDTIADLHMELLAFGPMAGLGWRFVRNACYAALLESGALRVVLAEIGGKPAGFVAFTAASISFHRDGLSRHWARAGFEVARAIVTAPLRSTKVLRAIRVLLSRRGETVLGEDPLGEVVCVAVRKEFLAPTFVRQSGLRLSETLIQYASAELARSGALRMRMIVDADNRPVLMLYHLMGAQFEPYEQAGEPKVHVWFDLSKPSATARPVPPAWQRRAAAPAHEGGDWRSYWERMEDRETVFRIEARDYASRVRQRYPELRGKRALDFGCGFGHTAVELAPFFGTLALWDASATVRAKAYERCAHLANVEFLDLDLPAGSEGEFDVILVHSVLQYMSDDEILVWLRRWRSMLRDGGKLVLSDLLQPNASSLAELLGYVSFAWRKGFARYAFLSGLAEIGRYARARKARPLTVVPRECLAQWAADAKLALHWLPENLSHRHTRNTAVLCAVAAGGP